MTRDETASADARVKRTHQLVVTALIELTVQKGFSAVTVSDITKYAGINRATFYRHYQDKFDLLDRCAQSVYELLDAPEAKPRTSRKGDTEQMAPGLVAIFEHIHANAKFYRVMLGKNGDPEFAEKIRQYVQKRIRRSLPAELQKDETSVDLYLSYSSSASVGAVLWWLEHDMPYSPEEMATISYQVSAADQSPILGQVSSQWQVKAMR